MADSDLSIAAISNMKLEQTAQQAEVAVFKKAIKQSGAIIQQLIEGATKVVPPPGTGTRINVEA